MQFREKMILHAYCMLAQFSIHCEMINVRVHLLLSISLRQRTKDRNRESPFCRRTGIEVST